MKLARRDFALAGTAAALLPLLPPASARAEGSSARNVIVYCDPELRRAVEALDRPYRASGGARINVFCVPPWMMLAQIERVTQNDVLITRDPAMDDAVRRGLVTRPTRVPLGRNRLALAGFVSSAPAPARDPAAIRAMLGAGPLAAPDPTSITTLDSAAALAELGFTPPYPFRVLPAADGEDVAFLVAERRARFGLLRVTEAAADPALVVAALFPQPEPVGYAAAVTTITRSPDAGRFMDFLRSPAARDRLAASGLEGLA